MKEIIKANGKTYEVENMTTTTNTISFQPIGETFENMRAVFSGVSEFEIINEEGETYGYYRNLSLLSIDLNENLEAEKTTLTVVMHIANQIEYRLNTLEETQLEQDDLIAGIIFGEE